MNDPLEVIAAADKTEAAIRDSRIAKSLDLPPYTPRELQPSIALVTMVKDGMKHLPTLFQSVIGFADKAVILDTGSKDGTINWLKSQDILPVKVYESPFVNFEVSRNMLNVLARDEADWLLLLDDDMSLKFEKTPEEVKAQLDPHVGCYLLRHNGNIEYWVGRLVHGHRDWRYRGVTHEYLEGSGEGNPRLEGVGIEHHYNHKPEKFERDLKLLSADIARDPDDVRTIFYLANTLRDMGKTAAAIRFYCMRVNMGGWDEEAFEAAYEAARLAKDPKAMAKVHEMRPKRAEPSAWLSAYYKFTEPDNFEHAKWETIRSHIPYPTDELLFVKRAAYGPEFAEHMKDFK